MFEEPIIPLFKSNFSIGKSILTLKPDSSDNYPNGPKSILSIAKENELKEIYLVEDSFNSFFTAFSLCKENSLNLLYGLNFLHKESKSSDSSKITIFIKNKDGYKDLIEIHSEFQKNGFLDHVYLKSKLTNNLILCLPFYDSFCALNSVSFSKFHGSILDLDPFFFFENNNLPFDKIIQDSILKFAQKQKIIRSKTILYYKKSDIDAFLTYKCICNRSFGKKSFSKPNFEHFGSNEFCWESYMENNK